MKAFKNRKTRVIHAAAEFYIDGRDEPPVIYPMCKLPMQIDSGMFRIVDAPKPKINCLHCRRMEEFKVLRFSDFIAQLQLQPGTTRLHRDR